MISTPMLHAWVMPYPTWQLSPEQVSTGTPNAGRANRLPIHAPTPSMPRSNAGVRAASTARPASAAQ